MKAGIYYSAKFNKLDIVCETCKKSGGWVGIIPDSFEYICEFWNESTELERYKKALEHCKEQRDYYMKHVNEKLMPALENAELEVILNAEVQECK